MTTYPISVELNTSLKITVDLINVYQKSLIFHMYLIGGKYSNCDFGSHPTTLSGLL